MASKRNIKTLPPEMITEILYRLPSKSIGRFRCVSKGWLSLLTDPQFIKTHQNTLNQNHFIFASICNLYSHPFDRHEPVINPTRKLKLKLGNDVGKYLCFYIFDASCDGLILVSSVSFDYPKFLAVLNPTTSELVDLPAYEYVTHTMRPPIIQGPSSIMDMYGLGYDSVTDDYKVVGISCNLIAQPCFNYVSVYSLRNKIWRRVVDYPYTYNGFQGVYANGFIHWVCKKKDTDHSSVIVAFSLADECFTQVPAPNLCNDTDFMSKMDCRPVVLDGKLAVYNDSEIWLMNEYGVKESWNKIPLDKVGDIQILNSMIFGDNGKIRVASNGQMLIYDVEKGNFSETVCVWEPKFFKVKGNFVESLVSPKFSITN